MEVTRYKGTHPQNCKNCFTVCKHNGEDSEWICTRYFPYVPAGWDNKTWNEKNKK